MLVYDVAVRNDFTIVAVVVVVHTAVRIIVGGAAATVAITISLTTNITVLYRCCCSHLLHKMGLLVALEQ